MHEGPMAEYSILWSIHSRYGDSVHYAGKPPMSLSSPFTQSPQTLRVSRSRAHLSPSRPAVGIPSGRTRPASGSRASIHCSGCDCHAGDKCDVRRTRMNVGSCGVSSLWLLYLLSFSSLCYLSLHSWVPGYDPSNLQRSLDKSSFFASSCHCIPPRGECSHQHIATLDTYDVSTIITF